MTKYETGVWHGWNGGECPVHPQSVVQVQHVTRCETVASELAWMHNGLIGDIIAFRVVKEHKEPREFLAVEFNSGSYVMWMSCEPNADGAVLFREAME